MTPGDTYFEAGEPVQAIGFDYGAVDADLGTPPPELSEDAIRRREREETIAWVLRILFSGQPDLDQVARRACCLAYVAGSMDAPATSIRQLAEHFKVSPTRAAQICTLLEQIILENPRD